MNSPSSAVVRRRGVPPGRVHDIEVIEGAEDEAGAIGRQPRPAHQPRPHRGPVVDSHRRVGASRDLGLHAGGERNRRRLPGGDVDALQLPGHRDDDRLPVGQEVVARQRVARGARFLVVARHRVGEPALRAGLEIADAQPGVGLVTRAVDQPLAVGREHRPHRAALRVGHLRDVAGVAVVAVDLPQREAGVVGESAGALRVVDEPAIGRDHRPHAVGRRRRRRPGGIRSRLRRRGSPDAHAVAAVAVVHVEPERARIGRPRLRHDQVLAVGRPRRRDHDLRAIVGAPILADGPRVGAVGVGDPQVLDPTAIAEEGDGAAVGRPGRLALERHAADDAGGGAAGDRQRVEVAEQVEDAGCGRRARRPPTSTSPRRSRSR